MKNMIITEKVKRKKLFEDIINITIIEKVA